MSASQVRETDTTIWISPFFACEMSAKQNDEQSCTEWEQAPESAFFLVEFVGHLPPACSVTCVRSPRGRDRTKGRRLWRGKSPRYQRSKTCPFWPCGCILWKIVYRNTQYTCIITVSNISWRSGHAIRSSSLLDFTFLHHRYLDVSSQFSREDTLCTKID